mgnify:FL=1
MENKSNLSVNTIWTISLLAIIIILLLSYIIWGKIEDASVLVEYISYAGTLLSITLSIFAIQYTYHSNNRAETQFDKINQAAENIIRASESMTIEAGVIKEKLADIETKQNTLNTKIDIKNQNSSVENLIQGKSQVKLE